MTNNTDINNEIEYETHTCLYSGVEFESKVQPEKSPHECHHSGIEWDKDGKIIGVNP